jgi:hypothetical protein
MVYTVDLLTRVLCLGKGVQNVEKEDFGLTKPLQVNALCTLEQTMLLLFYFRPLLPLRRGGEAQMVEALRYKPEGRGFDSLLFHYN